MSDAESERLEEEGGGWWPGFGPLTGKSALDQATTDWILANLTEKGLLLASERYPHSYPHCCMGGRTSICTTTGKLGAASLAISNDCEESVACWWQSTGMVESSPSHGMPPAILALIRSSADSPGQT